MFTNHQPRKFSFSRSLRFAPARLLLPFMLLIALTMGRALMGMTPEAGAVSASVEVVEKSDFHSLCLIDLDNKTHRNAGSKTEAVVPSDSLNAQTFADCYEWEYINGEWTLVRVPC